MNALTIIALIQAGMAAAPDVIKFAASAKAFIESLFTSKAITAEQQNELYAFVDDRCAARLRGETPPHWKVEPDPA